MINLLAKRFILLFPTLFVTSALVFMILSMGPSPMAQLQEFSNISAEQLATIAHKYGWDQPMWRQYFNWFTNFFTGDWGESIRTFRPAADMIFERLPLTLVIASLSIFFSVGIGVPIGAYVAVRKYSKIDYASTFTTLILMSVPAFFVALMLQLFAVFLRSLTGDVVVYTSGVPDGGNLIEWAQRLALPIATLTLTHIAIWVRYQRGELLNVLGQNYVQCARAKGLPERIVFFRHAWRNAILPIVTLIALDLGKLVGGAVIVESVFALPGIGTLLLEAIGAHDIPVVLDILMLVAVMMVIASTLADVVYGIIDPRARVEA